LDFHENRKQRFPPYNQMIKPPKTPKQTLFLWGPRQTYWQLTTGVEVDFIIGHMNCAVEAKSSDRITADHMKGLRELKEDYPEIARRIIVSRERISRLTKDGIEILSVADFLKELWDDKLIKS
jgi:hypothetical protein